MFFKKEDKHQAASMKEIEHNDIAIHNFVLLKIVFE